MWRQIGKAGGRGAQPKRDDLSSAFWPAGCLTDRRRSGCDKCWQDWLPPSLLCGDVWQGGLPPSLRCCDGWRGGLVRQGLPLSAQLFSSGSSEAAVWNRCSQGKQEGTCLCACLSTNAWRDGRAASGVATVLLSPHPPVCWRHTKVQGRRGVEAVVDHQTVRCAPLQEWLIAGGGGGGWPARGWAAAALAPPAVAPPSRLSGVACCQVAAGRLKMLGTRQSPYFASNSVLPFRCNAFSDGWLARCFQPICRSDLTQIQQAGGKGASP